MPSKATPFDDSVVTALREMIVAIVRDELVRFAAEQPRVPELVTIAAYAKARSISESTVRKAIREKRLEAQKIGRSIRIKPTGEIAPRVRDLKRALVDAKACRSLGLALSAHQRRLLEEDDRRRASRGRRP